MIDTITLGDKLKQCRSLSKLTLRQIEEATGISNSYLCQLENDKIKKPSANFLYKLSTIYNVDIEIFLNLPCATQPYFKNIDINLTSEEEDQLLKYLKFLRHK